MAALTSIDAPNPVEDGPVKPIQMAGSRMFAASTRPKQYHRAGEGTGDLVSNPRRSPERTHQDYLLDELREMEDWAMKTVVAGAVGANCRDRPEPLWLSGPAGF